MEDVENKYICLNCNEKAPSLYKRMNGKFIKLMECKNCGEVIDHYVECERSIIITDLFIQESSAYKHILYNSSNFSYRLYFKLILCIILSEGYVRWSSYKTRLGKSVTIHNNEYYYYIICLSIFVELITFGFVLLFLLGEKKERTLSIIFLKSIILGQSGRLLNIASIIYEQGSSFVFHGFILAFVFVSSVQSVSAVTFRSRITTGIDIAASMTISIIVSKLFQGFFI